MFHTKTRRARTTSDLQRIWTPHRHQSVCAANQHCVAKRSIAPGSMIAISDHSSAELDRPYPAATVDAAKSAIAWHTDVRRRTFNKTGNHESRGLRLHPEPPPQPERGTDIRVRPGIETLFATFNNDATRPVTRELLEWVDNPPSEIGAAAARSPADAMTYGIDKLV
jgi:hypothetical protein